MAPAVPRARPAARAPSLRPTPPWRVLRWTPQAQDESLDIYDLSVDTAWLADAAATDGAGEELPLPESGSSTDDVAGADAGVDTGARACAQCPGVARICVRAHRWGARPRMWRAWSAMPCGPQARMCWLAGLSSAASIAPCRTQPARPSTHLTGSYDDVAGIMDTTEPIIMTATGAYDFSNAGADEGEAPAGAPRCLRRSMRCMARSCVLHACRTLCRRITQCMRNPG